MRDKTKTETETRLDCKIISRPRLLINFQRKQDRDRDWTWFRISHKTKTRSRFSYTSVSRPRLSPISGMEAGTLPKKRREEEMYYVLRSIWVWLYWANLSFASFFVVSDIWDWKVCDNQTLNFGCWLAIYTPHHSSDNQNYAAASGWGNNSLRHVRTHLMVYPFFLGA